LGWEIVQAYADEGAKITICDLVAAEVEQAVARLRIAENRVLGVKADVTRELDVTEAIRKDYAEIRQARYRRQQRRVCVAALADR
jgi:NAD(P)-dependent dehydrogenase (short-subunit alcohol dehydrogenase family)